jgi:hypothetical protein
MAAEGFKKREGERKKERERERDRERERERERKRVNLGSRRGEKVVEKARNDEMICLAAADAVFPFLLSKTFFRSTTSH